MKKRTKAAQANMAMSQQKEMAQMEKDLGQWVEDEMLKVAEMDVDDAEGLANGIRDQLLERAKNGNEVGRQFFAAVPKLLSGRELKVIELRYGLDGGKLWTQAEVAERFHTTAEHIGEIEFSAVQCIFNSLEFFTGKH